MEFGKARNTIIHDGKIPPPMYFNPNPACTAYNGHFFYTAEFLLRGAIKVLLSKKPGYEDVWRSDLYRTIKATKEEMG